MCMERFNKSKKHITVGEETQDDREDKQQLDSTTPTESLIGFRLIELPIHLIYDILSRLPPQAIFCCRCVCKTFLKILTDPYFDHLIRSPSVAGSLILQDSSIPSGFVFVYMFDLEETSPSSSCSAHLCQCHLHASSRPLQALPEQNIKFQFKNGQVSLVGSCNGLLCFLNDSWSEPLYYVCNPILGEFLALPQLSSPSTDYAYLNHSGFGFCPKTKHYKVIRFMCWTSFDPTTALFSRKTVAEIHTLGTKSWRSIDKAACPHPHGSFDSLLNGILHWITDGITALDLICSFNLETEQFQSIPAPIHFDSCYIGKISWISVGVLDGHLCICYALGDAQFDVWVMKDYGVQESWTKEFAIDIKLYFGLRAENLHQPIKFLNNGDLLLMYNSNSLVSYSPCKGTFRDFKAFGTRNIQAVAHIPSFISLKEIARGKTVKKVDWENRAGFGLTGNFV